MKLEDVLEGARKATKAIAFGDTLKEPFKSLIGTMLSARTRDETTAQVCRALFKKVKNFQDILDMPAPELEKLIKPIGFYKTKVRYMKGIAEKIMSEYGGEIPDTIDDLVRLPGVGRKTANLVVAVAFGKPSVCVDTHVHRICNRTGIVKTKTPGQTEKVLRKTAPIYLWSEINRRFVPFGKRICTPISPHCSICPLDNKCPKIGVTQSR